VVEGDSRLARCGADNEYLNDLATAYTREFNKCMTSSRRLMRIRNVALMETVMKELGDKRALRVFSASEIMKGRGTIGKHGGLPKLDFLESFTEGCNLGPRRDDYNKQVMLCDSRLRKCAAQFTYEAREEVVLIFMKFVAAFSTMAGWLGGLPELSIQGIVVVMGRYGLPTFNSNDMDSEKSSDRRYMRALWDLCDDFLKLEVKSLNDDAIKRVSLERMKRVYALDSSCRVTVGEVHGRLEQWCVGIATEFLCWCYEKVSSERSPTDFANELLAVTSRVLQKLLREVKGEEVTIDVDIGYDKLRKRLTDAGKGLFQMPAAVSLHHP